MTTARPRDTEELWHTLTPKERAACHAGLRYTRFLEGWEPKGKDGKLCFSPAAKTATFAGFDEQTLDSHLLQALRERTERTLAGWRRLGYQTLSLTARQVSPFASRLGEDHPLENGFMFHGLYGLPCLPGSGQKGALRSAWLLRELSKLPPASSLSAAPLEKEQQEQMRVLFGTAHKNPKQETPQRRGALRLMDAFPLRQAKLRADVLTPHYKPFYEGTDTPSDWHDPVPIPFLTCQAGAIWGFDLILDPGLEETLVAQVRETLVEVLTIWGLGAKTSSGYGLFKVEQVATRGGEEIPREAADPETERMRDQLANSKQAHLGLVEALSLLERARKRLSDEEFFHAGRLFVQKIPEKRTRKKLRKTFPELRET